MIRIHGETGGPTTGTPDSLWPHIRCEEAVMYRDFDAEASF